MSITVRVSITVIIIIIVIGYVRVNMSIVDDKIVIHPTIIQRFDIITIQNNMITGIIPVIDRKYCSYIAGTVQIVLQVTIYLYDI